MFSRQHHRSTPVEIETNALQGCVTEISVSTIAPPQWRLRPGTYARSGLEAVSTTAPPQWWGAGRRGFGKWRAKRGAQTGPSDQARPEGITKRACERSDLLLQGQPLRHNCFHLDSYYAYCENDWIWFRLTITLESYQKRN